MDLLFSRDCHNLNLNLNLILFTSLKNLPSGGTQSRVSAILYNGLEVIEHGNIIASKEYHTVKTIMTVVSAKGSRKIRSMWRSMYQEVSIIHYLVWFISPTDCVPCVDKEILQDSSFWCRNNQSGLERCQKFWDSRKDDQCIKRFALFII